jgi:hypothetical protein
MCPAFAGDIELRRAASRHGDAPSQGTTVVPDTPYAASVMRPDDRGVDAGLLLWIERHPAHCVGRLIEC